MTFKRDFSRFKTFSLLLLALLLYNCGGQKKPVTTTKPTTTKPTTPKPPTPPKSDDYKVELPKLNREFRGAWVASVANINWPSKNNLSTDQQKTDAIALLDMLKNNNFNAVILQVRPSGDALYESPHEPWSYFLTGETGKKPFPYYDPLEFWIEEAHKRGMELHVWLNPYRAHHSNGGKVSSASLVNKYSEYTYRLKNGMYWFDPAAKIIQDHASTVVKDLVKRYNLDGVHFDDYFYPYATYNGGADFPDSKTWNQYKNAGGQLSRSDWRRDNVNKFVERIYKEIKTEKNYVKFGISPFGIWKPGYPQGIKGSSQYDELYADAKLWLNKGWIDYFAPQLYWPINSTGQSFPKLLEWWESENTMKRHLWPGLNTVEVKASDKPTEIVNQVQISREILKDKAGEIHWSIAGLTKSYTMQNALKTQVYQEKALIPTSPWLKITPLKKPTLGYKKDNGNTTAFWSIEDNTNVFQWVLYTKYANTWKTEILTSDITSLIIPSSRDGKNLNTIAIQAIDKLSNESEYKALKIN
ncbi:glycoside hydrolase family 10 protein [Soonwooa purpurea]